MSLEVYLATSRINRKIKDISDTKEVVTPGEIIKTGTDFMRGHGTFLEDDILYSSVAGVVDRINKLISVLPPKPKYLGQVGDVVIGRVISLGQKRWNIDIRARLDSVLMLASVHLPGGELRRRSEQDELMMRDFLSEGDLISAEIQAVYESGTVALHTRNLNYGKLSQGILLKVDSSLIKRCKIRTHQLACGATVILGNNGNIWISTTTTKSNRAKDYGGFVTDLTAVPMNERIVISRLRNCIMALAKNHITLYDTSLQFAYENSLEFSIKDLLKPEVMDKLVKATVYQVEHTFISYDDRIRKAYKDDLIVLKNLNLLD